MAEQTQNTTEVEPTSIETTQPATPGEGQPDALTPVDGPAEGDGQPAEPTDAAAPGDVLGGPEGGAGDPQAGPAEAATDALAVPSSDDVSAQEPPVAPEGGDPLADSAPPAADITNEANETPSPAADPAPVADPGQEGGDAAEVSEEPLLGGDGVEPVGESEPPADSAPAGDVSSEGGIAQPAPPADRAPPQDAPEAEEQADGSPGQPVIAQAVSDTQPIFGGAAHPSPAPDTGDEELLPHPALSGQNPGFIPGATESTQAFIPVPGELSAAAVAAQVIADAGASSGTGAPKQDQADPQSGGETQEPAPAAPEPADSVGDAEPAAPPPSTPAVPTAAHVPCAFEELNDDGSAALDDIDESEAEVLRLELQGLANIALALIKRIERVSQKKAVGEHLEGIQSSAERVVEQALNIFTTDESDLGGFTSASAELVLNDLTDEG